MMLLRDAHECEEKNSENVINPLQVEKIVF